MFGDGPELDPVLGLTKLQVGALAARGREDLIDLRSGQIAAAIGVKADTYSFRKRSGLAILGVTEDGFVAATPRAAGLRQRVARLAQQEEMLLLTPAERRNLAVYSAAVKAKIEVRHEGVEGFGVRGPSVYALMGRWLCQSDTNAAMHLRKARLKLGYASVKEMRGLSAAFLALWRVAPAG